MLDQSEGSRDLQKTKQIVLSIGEASMDASVISVSPVTIIFNARQEDGSVQTFTNEIPSTRLFATREQMHDLIDDFWNKIGGVD